MSAVVWGGSGAGWQRRAELRAARERRVLTVALCVSVIGHSVALSGLAVGKPVGRPAVPPHKFQLSYAAQEAPDHRSRWVPTSGPQPSTRSIIVPGPRVGGGPTVVGNVGSDGREALIRESLEMAFSHEGGSAGGQAGQGSGAPGSTSAAGVVDLTDVAVAAQGDPVRLAYFTAIREQVQRTADQQDWRGGLAQASGLVYIQFILGRTGEIRSVQILQDMSDAPALLCNTAKELVTASNPFPPFPPSFAEANLTILLPIEFAGPSGF